VAGHSVVVVGDQRDVHVAHLEFAGQDGFGVAGHVDDFPSLGLEPTALGPRREARSLDDHHGAGGMDLDAQVPADLQRHAAKFGTVGLGGADVGGDGTLVEGVRPTGGPVDELVAQHETARRNVGLQGTGGARTDQSFHAQVLHGPEVGPIGDLSRRVAVVPAVPGKEGDPPASDLSQGDLVAGRPVGGLDPDRLDVVQELIEARATEDSDLCTVLHDGEPPLGRSQGGHGRPRLRGRGRESWHSRPLGGQAIKLDALKPPSTSVLRRNR